MSGKIGIGFIDVSSDNGGNYFPEDNKLAPIDNPPNNEKYSKTELDGKLSIY